MSGGGNCWAKTVEAITTAPSTVVVNAEVLPRKPRLLAFLSHNENRTLTFLLGYLG
jgi:hypothetical protein